MSEATAGAEQQDLAPIDYVVIEFDALEPTGEGLDILLDLVDRGIIRILDLEVVKHNDDGTVVGMRAEDVSQMGIGSFDIFIGASTGLFTQEDFDAVAAILRPGAVAVAILYENTWAIPFVNSVRSRGGQVISTGRVSVDDLLQSLKAEEG